MMRCLTTLPTMILLAAVALSGCADNGDNRADDGNAPPPLPTTAVRLGNRVFTLEIARTDESRQRGLMHRQSLPPDRGMLFIFDQEAPRGFWMKNVPFPLDLVFLDGQRRVVDVKRLLPLDLRSTYGAKTAQYAIELNAGAAADAGLKIGDTVDLPPDLWQP